MKRLLGAVMALVLMAGCSTSEAAEDDASLAVAAEQPAAEASVEPTQPEPEPNQADVPTARPAPRRQAPAPQPVEPEPAPEPEPEPVPRLVIPAETTLFFVMDEGISTKNNTAGDQFTLSLSEDVTDAAGGVLLAAGTQAVGVISEAAESPGSDQPAVLRFTVESVVYENQLVPLAGQVVETEVQGDDRTSGTETAAKIGGGAAAGALLGRVIGGDTRDAVVGAVAGAAAGTALWLATRDGHAELPSGAVLTFGLAEAVVIY
jgi:hypothetical protein